MHVFPAFFRLIRWPNLVFIALSQLFFYFFITTSLVNHDQRQAFMQQRSLFYLLILASVLIAAAGYIINDYFDVNIDVVNKPEKVVVNRIISRRGAMFLHIVFSFVGLAISMYVSYKVSVIWIAIGNFTGVLLLLLYSATFKRKVLSGNIIISLLTAWVIMVVYYFSGGRLLPFQSFSEASTLLDMRKLFLLALTYSGFAFCISLVREVVKDMEDVEGDSRYGCRTIPIAWGIPAAKVFTGVWIVVLAGALVFASGYAMKSEWWLSAVYVLILMLIPLLKILMLLRKAVASQDYHRISAWLKWVMLTGIISMIFFTFRL